MVVDSLYKDIIPANSIGIKTIFFSKTDYIDVPKNTKKISNLNELNPLNNYHIQRGLLKALP